jgi:hypothetical protein
VIQPGTFILYRLGPAANVHCYIVSTTRNWALPLIIRA